MKGTSTSVRTGVVFGVLALALTGVMTTAVVVRAGDSGDVDLALTATVVSSKNVERAAADRLDLRVSRWSTDAERESLVNTLRQEGNSGLIAALAGQEETGWARFDPRGGPGAGRDPRKTELQYSREIEADGTKEIILVSDQLVGYGSDQAADGSLGKDFKMSIIRLKLRQDDKGVWRGEGRMVVGAKLRISQDGEGFEVDAFRSTAMILKDVKIKK